MTIQVITGCIAEDIIIDAVPISDISEKQLDKIRKRAIDKVRQIHPSNDITDKTTLSDILLYLTPESWDNESEPCDLCGETVSWEIYKI